MDMTFGRDQSLLGGQRKFPQRGASGALSFAESARPRFEVVTWLSYNKCLPWEINGLHFLFPHFVKPAWLTGSFKSKKRSWEHLVESKTELG